MAVMNRRKTDRKPMRRLPVQFAGVGFLSLFEKGPRATALAADVSETGMQIVWHEPLARWEELFVILSLDGEQSVRVRGRVAWCIQATTKDGSRRLYRIGIEFRHPGASLRSRIRQVIEQQAFDARLRRMRITGHGGPSAN